MSVDVKSFSRMLGLGMFNHMLVILGTRMMSVDYKRGIKGALIDFRKQSMVKQLVLCGQPAYTLASSILTASMAVTFNYLHHFRFLLKNDSGGGEDVSFTTWPFFWRGQYNARGREVFAQLSYSFE